MLTKTSLSGPFFSFPGSLSSLRGEPFGGNVSVALSSGSAHGGRTSEWTALCVWDRGSLMSVSPEAAEAQASWGLDVALD